ncbi:unnamed protein product, partial [Hapterophycus canaliculatus]
MQTTAVATIRRLHEHRMWSRRSLCKRCECLTEKEMETAFPIGQGCVWATLLHLHAADFVWLEALNGNESPLLPGDLPGRLPGNQLGADPIAGFRDLMHQWRDLDDRWLRYLLQIDDSTVSRPVAKVSTSSGAGVRHVTPAIDVLLHVCTHSQ